MNTSTLAKNYQNHAQIQHYTFSELLIELLNRQKKPKKILDLGCGPGHNTQILKSFFPQATMIGIDNNNSFINYAQTHFPQNTFLNQNINHYSFTESYDAIISNAVLQWLKNPHPILQKMVQSLNKNGCLIATIFGPKTYQELNNIIQKEKNIHTAALKFKTKSQWQKELNKLSLKNTLKEQNLLTTYPTLKALLRTIKQTQTNPNPPNNIWTQKSLKKLEENYLKEYGMIIATHQIWTITIET